jgi:hypothetical protein
MFCFDTSAFCRAPFVLFDEMTIKNIKIKFSQGISTKKLLPLSVEGFVILAS